MAILIACGERFNLLETGTVTVTSENSLFPATGLYDGRVSAEYRAASAVADLTITIDGNRIANGLLDAWSGGSPSNFTEANGGTGTVTETTTTGLVVSGSAAVLSAGTSTASAYQDIQARSGEILTLAASLAGTTPGITSIRLQNRETGKYLTSAGAWTTASTGCLSNASTSHATTSVAAFTVETFSTTQEDQATLRVTMINSSTGTDGYVDDLYLWPAGINLASIHGHNIDPSIAVQLRSSTDNFSASDTLQATLTMAQPTFYGYLSTAQDYRYWRLKFSGTNTEAIRTAEASIAQSLSLTRMYNNGAELRWMEDDLAAQAQNGDLYVYALSKHARRIVRLRFMADTQATFNQMRDEVYRRSRGRRFPLIVVPDTSLPDVLHGRIDRSWRAIRVLSSYYEELELVITESPFPATAS